MNKKNIIIFFALFYAFESLASTIQLKWQHYISDPGLKTQLKDYVFLKWDQKIDFYKGPFYFDSRIQSEYNLDSSKLFYSNIPELYFSYKYDFQKPVYHIQSIEFNVGRKAKEWSFSDEYWDMGLWNPMIRWNPLHPETSGLTGSFLTLLFAQWSMDFFLGALYFPDQGVKFIEKDGEAYSKSRWFSPLPDRVDSLDIDIYYLIRAPFIFDVLFQQSYALSFKTWSETPKAYYWMKWSIADKPVNHLFFVLNKTKLFRIGKEEGREGSIYQNITFLPVRQRLLSIEWGGKYKGFSTVFTLENIKMREVDISPEGWDFLNQRENFTYFSTLLKYDLSEQSFIQAAYIQTWFRNYSAYKVNLKGEKHPSILRKHKVLEGIGLDGQKEFLSSKGLKRILALSYRYSFLNEGSWLFLKAVYFIAPKFYAEMALDILGAKGDKHYFLSQFRHNDYLSWSLAYDF